MYPEIYHEYPDMNSAFPMHIKRKKLWKTPAHRHDYIELAFVVGGYGVEKVNGDEHVMMRGALAMRLPYQVHEITSDPDNPLDLYICNFSLHVLLEDAGEDDKRLFHTLLGKETETQRSHIQVEGAQFDKMKHLFEDMLDEYEHQEPWKSIVLKSQLIKVLVLYARYHLTPTPAIPSIQKSGPSKPIWVMMSYVHKHYLQPITLSHLAAHFHMHPTSISDIFRKEAGIHLIDFLHELRVRHACSLLKCSDMPITDIGEEAGFGSYSSFNRIFRQKKELSPREYRKRARED